MLVKKRLSIYDKQAQKSSALLADFWAFLKCFGPICIWAGFEGTWYQWLECIGALVAAVGSCIGCSTGASCVVCIGTVLAAVSTCCSLVKAVTICECVAFLGVPIWCSNCRTYTMS